ncbi:unnamed protein product [Amoebophrya sp. A25]|nr:unnamed protein product [Amoebophrya sp. A25]|eukprot:GSA25T00009360001.1
MLIEHSKSVKMSKAPPNLSSSLILVRDAELEKRLAAVRSRVSTTMTDLNQSQDNITLAFENQKKLPRLLDDLEQVHFDNENTFKFKMQRIHDKLFEMAIFGTGENFDGNENDVMEGVASTGEVGLAGTTQTTSSASSSPSSEIVLNRAALSSCPIIKQAALGEKAEAKVSAGIRNGPRGQGSSSSKSVGFVGAAQEEDEERNRGTSPATNDGREQI